MSQTRRLKSNYFKFDHVVLHFDKLPARGELNALHLFVRDSAIDWNRPVSTLACVYVNQADGPTILTEFILSVWAAEDLMAPIVAACKAKSKLPLAADLPFVTQLAYEDGLSHLMSIGTVNAVHVLETVNEFAWMQASNVRPSWYVNEQHGEIFDPNNRFSVVDYDHADISRIFDTPGFQRALEADRLLQKLENISPSDVGAGDFHDWVVLALRMIFFSDPSLVDKNPNGNAAERRDIVATNMSEGHFWRRLREDYKVRMPVFEVKNYPEPTVGDFRQVHSYLALPHHGALGFLVTRAEDRALSPAALRQFREMYRKDGLHKLIIILPSDLLAELLNDIQWGRAHQADRKMSDWLGQFLLRHIYE